MKEVQCSQCPLRRLSLFVENSHAEVAYVQSVKQRELHLDAGQLLIYEGQASGPVYTLLLGFAFRFKTLHDGRRQILGFLMAGDYIGVQQNMGEMACAGVMTLTDSIFCVFDRNSVWELHQNSPALGFSVTWLIALEASRVDDCLLSVGRRNAEERVASLLLLFFRHARALQKREEAGGVPFPLTQQHIADALGLSLVHTNKTLRRLALRGLYLLRDGYLTIADSKALAAVANLHNDGDAPKRPLV